MSEDIEICHCMGIMKSEIENAILEKGLTTVDEVGEETEAGIKDLEKIKTFKSLLK